MASTKDEHICCLFPCCWFVSRQSFKLGPYRLTKRLNGLTAAQVVIWDEDPAAFESLRDYLYAHFRLDGTTIVVGSPTDDDVARNAGSAYVFIDDGGGNYTQQAKLRAFDAAESDLFADENATVQNDVILIGAALDDDNGDNSGSVYVFGIDVLDGDGDLIPDDIDQDDDNDGIADNVENAYPFLNRVDATDALEDFDGDGINNLREALAGYRLDDAASVPDEGYVAFGAALLIREESEGFVPVEVRRLRGDVGSLTVTLQTFDGPEVAAGTNQPILQAGVDYTETIETLTWVDGDTSPQIVNVPLINTATRRNGLFGVRLVPDSTERILLDESRVLVFDSDIEFSGIDFGGTTAFPFSIESEATSALPTGSS